MSSKLQECQNTQEKLLALIKEDGNNFTLLDECPFCIHLIGSHKIFVPSSAASSSIDDVLRRLEGKIDGLERKIDVIDKNSKKRPAITLSGVDTDNWARITKESKFVPGAENWPPESFFTAESSSSSSSSSPSSSPPPYQWTEAAENNGVQVESYKIISLVISSSLRLSSLKKPQLVFSTVHQHYYHSM